MPHAHTDGDACSVRSGHEWPRSSPVLPGALGPTVAHGVTYWQDDTFPNETTASEVIKTGAMGCVSGPMASSCHLHGTWDVRGVPRQQLWLSPASDLNFSPLSSPESWSPPSRSWHLSFYYLFFGVADALVFFLGAGTKLRAGFGIARVFLFTQSRDLGFRFYVSGFRYQGFKTLRLYDLNSSFRFQGLGFEGLGFVGVWGPSLKHHFFDLWAKVQKKKGIGASPPHPKKNNF